jgi:pimeloyl-ACP methyl ester carboxylesterase
VQTSHGALNVVRTPGNGRTAQSIVLLSGLGTPAPAVDFAPLIRELGDYDVVVVEGFGYGYSVPSGGINWEGLIAASGLVRWATMLAPSMAEPDGTAYTSGERDQMRKMANWNFGNPTVLDETNRIADNSRKVQAQRYPDNLPVLTFLASAKETSPDNRLHESRLQNVQHHEIVTLPGGHYLHWTHAPVMATKIKAFLTANTPGMH